MTLSRSLAERERLWSAQPGHFWTLDRVADALNLRGPGTPHGTRSFPGVSTDTRRMQKGDLFLALRGERFDAHDFVAAAVQSGAGAVVVSRADCGAGLGVPVFVVDDTLRALAALAHYRRRAWGASSDRIIAGITGTNGKTSTKDLTAAALSSVLNVHATEGNLNNQVGVPLTLLSLDDHAHVAVIEMGTSMPGEIAILRDIAEPEIAVVTSVSEGHLEGLGSLDGVMREKTSIFSGVQVAIAPASQPEIGRRAAGLARYVVEAGLGGGQLSASQWGTEPDGSGWLEVGGVQVRVPLRGVHNLRNAMLALAVAREAGIDIARAAEGIAAMSPRSMRMETTRLGGWSGEGERPRGALLINDAYNSNPGSALAALEYLQSLPVVNQRVVVFGGMRELGAQSTELHDRVARRALESNADVIAGMGDFAIALARVAPDDARVVRAPDVDELWARLRERLEPGATILLKASRGERLERIVPHIQLWAES